ncbi:hypothetical protein CORC01_01252 [Colletotrichum orchidophilum]|uniref:Uncharacterized protein n=1 Tax=Colletotrichum orchidophilum TaxID=1209926 RepID=A0A1G4BQC7_9PEZI|nr:uncharacterized protein CORC01_01252 [Colletotrichum orchidophilum]OHF03533.1 hypothetical protein CORC01_01252 [Colletotrichum orchidophilum]
MADQGSFVVHVSADWTRDLIGLFEALEPGHSPTRLLCKGTKAFFFPQCQLPGQAAIVFPYRIPGRGGAEPDLRFGPELMLPRSKFLSSKAVMNNLSCGHVPKANPS